MITIIEGTDACGKSTYARHLVSKFNKTNVSTEHFKYIHADKPSKDNWFDEYISPVLAIDNFVLDRWHLGEIVWPQIYGRQSLFNDLSFDKCNWYLAKLDTTLIVLTRKDSDIVNELNKRGESNQIDLVLQAKYLFFDAYKKVKYVNKKIIESNVVHQCL